MHWRHPMEVVWERKCNDWCFSLNKPGLIYSIRFQFDYPECFLISWFVPLQYCQRFWWGSVCLPKPTDCPVHQETEGHQQIPHEEVSYINLLWKVTKYINSSTILTCNTVVIKVHFFFFQIKIFNWRHMFKIWGIFFYLTNNFSNK